MNRQNINHTISGAELRRFLTHRAISRDQSINAKHDFLKQANADHEFSLYKIDTNEMLASALCIGKHVLVQKRKPKIGDILLLRYNGSHQIVRRLAKQNRQWVLKTDHWKDEVLVIHPTTVIEFFGVIVLDEALNQDEVNLV